ncbi:glycosyltransferase family 1 protein [Meridianimaribacter sp. CL38]|uniref:glycosyltransferase family protein n=1 Tax=Meridianimaribacter sp. CL38 TaxID=2213021 RepID=UPI00103ABE43|nr:glycosyltransferase [Meridianimaribacter sp. CL38]TBV27611.1 glycosyltransferase family 1 protein [Meridianimaribacter sp. CL38]
MRILLIGEYSRLHNSLKEGLTALGHEVLLVGNGDGFKNYPVDIRLDHSFHSKFLKKIKIGFYRLTSIDIGSWEIYFKTLLINKKLKGFDVVQLINESSIKATPKLEIKFLKRILKQNKKLFLLSCGIDYQCMKYMMEGKFEYSIMSPYLEDKSLFDLYKFQLQYLNEDYTKLHNFIYNNSNGVIATDMDYHIPLLGNKHYLGLIPNPINIEKIKYTPLKVDDKIKIFHGVNTKAIVKKGNQYFSDALKIIEKKYGDKVEIKTTYSIPYNEYIKLYDECHILLDQVYGYDQGYNALEAMAKGKVVLTGAEKEFEKFYDLKHQVAVNVKPDVNQIVNALSDLIENPEKIINISKSARTFIEDYHDYKKIAKKYSNAWSNN